MLFSQRNNLVNDARRFQRFRNRAWNAFDRLVEQFHEQCTLTMGVGMLESNWNILVSVADKLGLNATTGNVYALYDDLQEYTVNASQIEDIFDLIEAHIEVLFEPILFPRAVMGVNIVVVQNMAIEMYSRVIQDENLPYQLYDRRIVALVDDAEMEEIEKAADTEYESVNRHIEKAWLYFSDRKSPDYPNSIKESISAVEAMCCIINGKNSTLNTALAKLKNNGVHIHTSLEKGFILLYAYTCDEKGIRHAGIDFVGAPEEDARYMLVSCSAFINYLIEKWNEIHSD